MQLSISGIFWPNMQTGGYLSVMPCNIFLNQSDSPVFCYTCMYPEFCLNVCKDSLNYIVGIFNF